MAKRSSKPQASVQPCERAPGKFEAVYPDGTVHPYAFRTEAEAWAVLGPQKDDEGADEIVEHTEQ